MAKFKIGDKVIAKKNDEYAITTDGWRGTVVGTLENPNGQIFAPGDDIRVKGNDGLHFSVESKYFDFDESTSNQKIVITTDGKTTTAKLYDGKKFVKAAKATCSPEDEFNIVTGAAIAFSRLFDADINFVDENDNSFDWTAFKNDEFFVQVTEDNFGDFVKEAEKHDCFFVRHDKVNPFKDNAMRIILDSSKAFAEKVGIPCAPNDTVYIGYQEDSLRVCAINVSQKSVFVW